MDEKNKNKDSQKSIQEIIDNFLKADSVIKKYEDISQEDIENAERHGYQVMDVPLEKKHDFEVDLNRALIDLAGIALQSAYKYIQYNILSQNFKITNTNPFLKEIIETGMYDSYQIKDFFKPELVPEILYTKKIFIHRRLIKEWR